MVLLVSFITTATTLKKTYRGKPLILAPGFRDHSPRLAESNDWGLRYGRLSHWGGCVAEGSAHIKVSRKRRKQRAGVWEQTSRGVSSVICILKSEPTPYLHRPPTIPPIDQGSDLLNDYVRVFHIPSLLERWSATKSRMYSLWEIIPVQVIAKE